jgi:sec-independent protein translocase protein TatA
MGLDNPIHLMLLLVILLLVFGAKRLPEMGRSLGHGLRGFKDAIGGEPTIQHLDAAPPAVPTTPATASTSSSEPALVTVTRSE